MRALGGGRAPRGLVPGPAAARTASVRRGLRFVWIATRQSAGARAAAATAAAAAAARTRDQGAAALEEAGNGSETIEQMLEAYLLGDAEALAAVMEKAQRKESKEFAEKFRELLIVARNKGMTKRILELLKEHPKRSHFFAVGAAHTYGEDGVVDLLREQGVKVERLDGAGDVVAEPAPKKPADAPVERRKAG